MRLCCCCFTRAARSTHLLLFFAASVFSFGLSKSFPSPSGITTATAGTIFVPTTRRQWLGGAVLTTLMTTTANNAAAANADDALPPPPVRWGIVGLGDVTAHKSGPPFYKCRGSELVAVMRRTPGKAAEWVEQQNVPSHMHCKGYDDLDEFLNHPGLDAVYVATRPGTHLEICRKVAAARKAVYVEKPVGRCADETEAIAECAAQVGVPLYTAYISRAYERTQRLRKLLQDGAVGDRILKVEYGLVGSGLVRGLNDASPGSVPWRLDASQSGGGLVMDVGCHVLDRIDYLFGPLVDVRGSAASLKALSMSSSSDKDKRIIPVVEDYVKLQAKIGTSNWAAIRSDGAYVSCSWDFSGTLSKEDKDELRIVGSDGFVELEGMSPSGPIRVFDANGCLEKELTFEQPQHTAQPMIQAVTDDLRGLASSTSTQQLLLKADNAIRTSRVLDTVLCDYYGGRQIGYWENPTSWPGNNAASAAINFATAADASSNVPVQK